MYTALADVVNVLIRKQEKPGDWTGAVWLLAPLTKEALHMSHLYGDECQWFYSCNLFSCGNGGNSVKDGESVRVARDACQLLWDAGGPGNPP